MYVENEDTRDINVFVEKINEDCVEAKRGRQQNDAFCLHRESVVSPLSKKGVNSSSSFMSRVDEVELNATHEINDNIRVEQLDVHQEIVASSMPSLAMKDNVVQESHSSSRVGSEKLRPKHVSQEVSSSSSFPQKATPRKVQRTNSCPLIVTCAVVSGLWSLEWLNDHKYGNVGLIFSTKKKSKQA